MSSSSATFGPQGAPLLTPPVSPVTGHPAKPPMVGGDTCDRVNFKEVERPKNGFYYQRVESPKQAPPTLPFIPIAGDEAPKSAVLTPVGRLAIPQIATVRNMAVDGLALINRTSYGPGADTPMTVPQRFAEIANDNPDAIAFYVKRGPDSWEPTTYAEYYQLSRTVAKAFLSLGLQRFHSVAIIGFNSAEWFIANFAAIFAGGISTGVYTTNSAEACHHILQDCRANICVVDDEGQMRKVLKVADKLPHLKAVVQYRGQLNVAEIGKAGTGIKFMMWEDLPSMALNTPEAVLNDISASLSPGNCCALIYTSGTTGNSKGVMISHDNLLWTAQQIARTLRFRKRQDSFVSYLPLSHVAAQITDMYLTMDGACTTWFANPDALKGSLVPTLKDARPTIFVGVPRVWEKIAEKMQAVSKSATGLKRFIATWAKNIGTKGTEAMMLGTPLPWGYWLADALVFRKVKRALGLDRCRYFVSTGAPIARTCLDYFASLGIRIMEVYGMSECTGPATMNYCLPGEHWLGSSGLPLMGTTMKICYDVDQSADKCDTEKGNGLGEAAGVGEICIKGRNVFMGYLNMKQQTLETLEGDGWLRTGDIGKLQKTKTGGPFLFITGRLKELIITAGGENIAPVPIEDAIKEELRDIVSNAMVVGDYKKFLSVLLTLKTEVDELSGLPTDTLVTTARDFIVQTLGRSADKPSITSVQQIMSLKHPSIHGAIQKGIDRANAKSVSHAATVRKWTIVAKDFTVATGELGPTMKLRRPIVSRKYGQIIDSLYTESNDVETVKATTAASPTTPAAKSESSITIDVAPGVACNGNAAFALDE